MKQMVMVRTHLYVLLQLKLGRVSAFACDAVVKLTYGLSGSLGPSHV